MQFIRASKMIIGNIKCVDLQILRDSNIVCLIVSLILSIMLQLFIITYTNIMITIYLFASILSLKKKQREEEQQLLSSFI